jgi:hypothetical protein
MPSAIDILGVVRWVERIIVMWWPESTLGKFFSNTPPPPPQQLPALQHTVGTAAYKLMERQVLLAEKQLSATEDCAILMDSIHTLLVDETIITNDLHTKLTALLDKGLPKTRS